MAKAKAPLTERWQLRLYVAGQTPKSIAALANLERLCQSHLAGDYEIEVIDLTATKRPSTSRPPQ